LIPQYEDVVADLDNDVDMDNMGTDGSTFNADDGDNDAKTEPVLTSPPRKKAKVAAKAAKPKVRAAVKAAQVEELNKAKSKAQGRERVPVVMVDNDGDVEDLDPTPIKHKRVVVPAAEWDDDLEDQWAMPIGGNDGGTGVEAITRPRGGEGKGKGKADDNKANTQKAPDRRDTITGSDAKRAPPASKKSVLSHQACSLLTKPPFIITFLATLP
jgi:hypothetical protein